MKNRDIRAEILAPAGSYESFEAAINAGADAIYLGGNMFGARAYANNFNEEEVIRALDYAHVHDKKVYMTVNTLFKNSEIYDSLYDYLRPYYEEGLDAVIVQDVGAFEFIRNTFPNLHIHASTQMTVSGVNSAKLLKEAGATRVVTARELSLQEIRDIYDNVDIEIESFVHGALCYCYSGQCLMSSFIGGRSGNRGRCAQPCRLPYTYNGDKKYYLSPKDLNALMILPDVIEAGVYSLKIEGRMKKPWYTAGVVSAYRKYLDYYYEHGKASYKVSDADMNMLSDLYNRGGFTSGYYVAHNGKKMMSIDRPNHQGVKVADIISSDEKNIKFKLRENINEGDVLEISETPDDKIEWTEKNPAKRGTTLTVRNTLKHRIKSDKVLRTRNNMLISSIEDDIRNVVLKEKINASLSLCKDRPAYLCIWYRDICIEKYGQNVECAVKRPMDKEQILKQMNKMGNTPFEFESINIDMEDDIFIPVSALNELRREAVDELYAMIKAKHKRKHKKEIYSYVQNSNNSYIPDSYKISVYLENSKYLDMVTTKPEVDRIIIDMGMSDSDTDEIIRLLQSVKNAGKEAYIMLPHIFRKNCEDDAKAILDYADGVMIKNIDELAYVHYLGYTGRIIGDYSLYAYNNIAYDYYKKYGVSEYTLPVELNYGELKKLSSEVEKEIICYGYQITMVSAQCITATTSGCSKVPEVKWLKDRMNNSFAVKNNCKYCYNTIYNTLPTSLISNIDDIDKLGVSRVRVNITIEDEKTASKIIDSVINTFYYRRSKADVLNEFTRGHFKRGVE